MQTGTGPLGRDPKGLRYQDAFLLPSQLDHSPGAKAPKPQIGFVEQQENRAVEPEPPRQLRESQPGPSCSRQGRARGEGKGARV